MKTIVYKRINGQNSGQSGALSLPAENLHPYQKTPSPGFWAKARRAAATLAANRGRLLAGLALALLLVLGLVLQARLAGYFPGWSLRYDTPLEGGAANAARRYVAQNPDPDFWPTFWSEAARTTKSELRQANAQCLYYSGEGDLVWPARFARGGWPGATDAGGCAVSEALAWGLWGSHDVVGKQLTIDGKSYTVRGVFVGDDPLCLLQTAEETPPGGWQGAELRPLEGKTRADVEAFAASSGLGAPDAVVNGGRIRALTGALTVAPALFGALLLAAKPLGRAARRYPRGAKIALLAGALLLALCLPRLLGVLPPDIVPTRWSDFSHWEALAGSLSDALTEFLALRPTARDVAGKKDLLALLAASLLALTPAILLARPGPRRQGGRAKSLTPIESEGMTKTGEDA